MSARLSALQEPYFQNGLTSKKAGENSTFTGQDSCDPGFESVYQRQLVKDSDPQQWRVDMGINFVTNEQLYKLAVEPVAAANSFVWIGTADLKDLHVHYRGSVQSFLAVLDGLVKRKVEIRLLHASEPGVNFRRSFDKYPLLWKSMERQLCPRIHFKCIIIDGKFAYSGSANLTGAGLGIKGENTRNFESGFVTDDPGIVGAIMAQFDEVWIGRFCKSCKRREFCGDPIL